MLRCMPMGCVVPKRTSETHTFTQHVGAPLHFTLRQHRVHTYYPRARQTEAGEWSVYLGCGAAVVVVVLKQVSLKPEILLPRPLELA